MDSALYDVAAGRFSTLLTCPESVNFTLDDVQWITLQIVIAHVRANQPIAASKTLKQLKASPESQFWRAQAMVQLGEFTAAEKLLGELLLDPPPEHKDACHFARARVLVELDRLPEAVEELSAVTKSKDDDASARARVAMAETLLKMGRTQEIESIFDGSIKEPYQSQLRYIVGLAALQEQVSQKAARAFKDVLKLRDRLPADLVTSSEIGLAIALAKSGQPENAILQLIATIDRLADDPLLLEAFTALETLQLLSLPTVASRLQQWSKEDDTIKASIARYYAIVAEETSGRDSNALAQYAAFIVEQPEHPLIPQALLRQTVLLARSPRKDAQNIALETITQLKNYAIPDNARELVDYLEAKAYYSIANAVDGSMNVGDIASASDNFRRAEAAFRKATNGTDLQTAAVAHYDAAISALRADAQENLSGYLSALDQNPGLKGNLLIERGLYLAANQHFRDAQAALETFIEFSPNHPRAFAAHLALAEIAIRKLEPGVRTALRHLELAQSQPDLTDYQKQQLDYTRFWLEISQRSDETTKMVALGNRFLKDWPTESPWRDDVQMKLGEHYYRTENYPLAISMFESLEKESPDSDLAEPALYFAGKANMRLDPIEGPARAFVLWNRVVAKGGPLSISARYQQALVKRRQLEYDDAAGILRSLLDNEKVAGEERKAILCSLGETLFSQSNKDSSKLPEAEKIFLEAAGGPEDSPSWRNQALYRLAKCYEHSGNTQSAKEAYFKVFDTVAAPIPDYTWFYRAGSQLFDLLKAEKNWDAAIAIATRLADSQGTPQGPRAKEFAQKAERLRLEHFKR